MRVLHCTEVSPPMSQLGHEPPRPPQAGVTGLPPIAATRTHGCGGGSGPISDIAPLHAARGLV